MPIMSLIENPKAFLLQLLVSLPAMLMSLVLHEVAHGYVAWRCGDPTAKMLGRLTLNPLKHLDPVGSLMMLLVGYGWARPVPVNPLNYRNYRRDDLLVSLAGITMNLILCVLSTLILNIFLLVVLHNLPDGYALTSLGLENLQERYYYTLDDLFRHAYGISPVITELAGETLGTLYQIIAAFPIINLCLAVFNLLPVPPLDGYHVLNDLFLKRSLFEHPQVVRVTSMLLFVVVFATDWLDKVFDWLIEYGLGGFCHLIEMAARAMGWL